MSKPKRRRMLSSDDEDEIAPENEELKVNLDGSFLDLSCNEIRLSPPSVVATPESSPVHNQYHIDGSPRSPNHESVNEDDFSLDISEVGLTNNREMQDETLPLVDDDCSNQDKHNVTELLDDASCSNAPGDSYLFTHGSPSINRTPALAAAQTGQSLSDSSVSDSETDNSSILTYESSGDENCGVPDLDTSDDNDSYLSLDSDEEIVSTSMDPPIYDGADITVDESMTAVLAYIIRHEISGKEIGDLLRLINLHCRSQGNKMRTSLYFFKKYFSLLDVPVKYHYYCAGCCVSLPNRKAFCPNIQQHPELSDKNVFVELPLIPQVQAHFSKEEFFTNFNYSKQRTKRNSSNIEDVYDGQLYKELVIKGFFSTKNPLNFSAIINTDGVPVFHSNNKSLWPIFLNILEMPPHLRFKEENTLIAGLWFGKKPHINLMLAPLLPSFQALAKGISIKPFGSDEDVKVQGIVLASTCDIPAKIMMLGMSSYSGAFGCQICKMKGGGVKIVKSKNKKQNEESVSSVWVYKYSKDLELRNHEETVKFSREAQKLLQESGDPKTNVFGVKFPSATFKIMYDAIRGFSIDDLHTLYLGVSKTLLNLWFDSKHSSQPFSVRKHLALVDQRLEAVKLPNFLEHGAITIETNLCNWKGKDYLTWLHYLSVPILKGVLPDKYLEHYIDLVVCLQILQSDSISPDDLILCDKTLHTFVKNFEILYGSRHMTMVFHLLLHLVYVITNLGPLKYLSCFPYEGLNGEMLKMLHGTKYIETQLASSAYLIQKLPNRLRSLKTDSNVKEYCEKMLHPSKRLKILDRINEDSFSVGTYVNCPISDNNVTAALKQSVQIGDNSELKSFLRLKKGKHLFLSKKYLRTTRNNSFTCSFYHNDSIYYGTIDHFLRVCSDVKSSCYSFYAMIEIGEVNPLYVGAKQEAVKHIMEFKLTGNLVAVPVNNLKDMMVFLDVTDSGTYVCEPLDHSLKS